MITRGEKVEAESTFSCPQLVLLTDLLTINLNNQQNLSEKPMIREEASYHPVRRF